MSFIQILNKWESFDFKGYFSKVTVEDVRKSLNKDKLSEFDFLNLLSDTALPCLEEMARKSHRLTLQYFGRTIQLYIPLYISNYCSNECAYCGFNHKNKIQRAKLSLEEVGKNALEISRTGIKHVLFLTGEAKEVTPLSYIMDAAGILKKYFASVSIEVFPMETGDYKKLKNAGIDGLTIYQEVYDREIYGRVHLAGPKRNYEYRLEAPKRGAIAGLRSVNIGPLFGLGEPVTEAFFCGLHAKYLQDSYPETEVSVSLPRLNEAEGHFKALHLLNDKKFVQFLTAFRLFLPRAGITVSTRENALFRDQILPLGVTKMSAGSSTSVGGYYPDKEIISTPQFEVADHRSVTEIAGVIAAEGYEPLFKDWDDIR